MKATIILADAARTHPDGTFSLLRGGIDRLEIRETEPAVLKASLLVRITVDPGEQGPHAFKVSLINEEGLSVAPDFSGNFDAPAKGGHVNLVSDLQMVLPKPGRYAFNLFLDSQVEASWAIDVVTVPPAQKGEEE